MRIHKITPGVGFYDGRFAKRELDNLQNTAIDTDLNLADDVKVYLDTAKANYIGYSSAHGDGLVLKSGASSIGYLFSIANMEIYSNTAADANGMWEPSWFFSSSGTSVVRNTTQGVAADRTFDIDFTSGVELKTGGASYSAAIKADNIASSNKTFQFPNASGTLALQEWAANQALSNLASVAINTSLISDTDSTDDLGSSGAFWKDLYVDNIVGPTVINEAGADIDFRIEGDTEENLLFVDASTDRVGIGTNAPDYRLHVYAGVVASGTGVATVEGTSNAGNINFRFENSGVGVNTRSALQFTFYDAGNNQLNSFVQSTMTDDTDGAGDTNLKFWIQKDAAFYLPLEIDRDDITLVGNLIVDTNTLYVDAANNRVGIGMTTPDYKLQVDGDIVSETDSTDDLGNASIFWDQTFTDELILTNVGAAAAAADKLVLSAVDLTGGNTILDINTEGTGVEGTGTPAADKTIAIRVNGNVRYLLASTAAS